MLSTEEIASRYAYPPELTKPWVRVNFVSTIDGAAQDPSGVSGGLGGPDDTAIFAVLRSLADVILVGAGTARAEGYGPVRHSEIHAEVRAQVSSTATPPIAVVSRGLEVPAKLVAPGQLLITARSSDPDKRASLARTMDVIVAGEHEIDWPNALAQLAERGLIRVLCEGGPHLHGDLIKADLVDELCLNVATVLLGGESARIARGDAGTPRPMRLADTVTGENLLATRWLRERF
ncbi:MAG: pyrimidine reductase family protein [Actinomycetales bacterium]|nr:pyrimidine reductase family protein [Actinomycetales bacterium]